MGKWKLQILKWLYLIDEDYCLFKMDQDLSRDFQGKIRSGDEVTTYRRLSSMQKKPTQWISKSKKSSHMVENEWMKRWQVQGLSRHFEDWVHNEATNCIALAVKCLMIFQHLSCVSPLFKEARTLPEKNTTWKNEVSERGQKIWFIWY